MASRDVAVAEITSGCGKFGSLKAAGVGLMHACLALVKTKPKYPWSPSHKPVLTMLVFARNSVLSRFSDLLVGYPFMGVVVGYLKYDAA